MKIIGARQSEIFQKVVRQNGRPFLVCFTVFEREGKLRGKIISCEPIEVILGKNAVSRQDCLPLFSQTQEIPRESTRFQELASPFFGLEFFMSQPIRAPSLS